MRWRCSLLVVPVRVHAPRVPATKAALKPHDAHRARFIPARRAPRPHVSDA